MSLPDLLKDVSQSNHDTKDPSTPLTPLQPCKPKKPLTVSASLPPEFEWESDSVSSLDEGEAAWDALGRMNSIRRSNRFDKPQLLTVQLHKTAEGFGLELESRNPPIIHAVCKLPALTILN